MVFWSLTSAATVKIKSQDYSELNGLWLNLLRFRRIDFAGTEFQSGPCFKEETLQVEPNIQY